MLSTSLVPEGEWRSLSGIISSTMGVCFFFFFFPFFKWLQLQVKRFRTCHLIFPRLRQKLGIWKYDPPTLPPHCQLCLAKQIFVTLFFCALHVHTLKTKAHLTRNTLLLCLTQFLLLAQSPMVSREITFAAHTGVSVRVCLLHERTFCHSSSLSNPALLMLVAGMRN